VTEKRGFTLIELLVAVAILLVLATLTIPYFYNLYLRNAMRAVVLTDLRNCLSLIVSKANTEKLPPEEAVNECSKSKYTTEIVLESKNPMVLRATGVSGVGTLTCIYDERSGSVSCEED